MKYLKIILVFLVFMLLGGCGEEPTPINNDPEKEPEIVETKEYLVEFYVDGVLYDSQKVKEGESANKPDDPVISGLDFNGWDTDYSNVKEDLYITALFTKSIIIYTATFFVLDEVYTKIEVKEGEELVYPTDPIVAHYDFITWDKPSIKKLNSDIEIKAILSQSEFLVTFFLDDVEYSYQYVKRGEYASDVELIIPSGREFIGWDKEFGPIMEDTNIYGTTGIDRSKEREQIDAALNELDIYFQSLNYPLVDEDHIDLVEKIGDVSIKWESENDQVILDTGRVKQPYSASPTPEFNLFATLTVNGYSAKHTFTVTVKRTFKDLSKGINAVYNYNGSSMTEAALRTYDIVYFAFIGVNIYTGKLSNPTGVMSYINGYKDKLHAQGGRAMVSLVAQGDTATTFRKVCDDPEKLETLANDILEYLIKNDLDGIDIDWETPGDDGAKSYTKLMKALYTKIKAYDERYLITSAIGAGPWQYNKYDLTNSAQYHDYINMMAYDMQSGTTCSFQNALYYKAGASAGNCTIEDTVRIYNSVGVKNSQIIVGVPFYGRESPNATYLGGSCGSNRAINQSTISSYLKNSNYKYYFDDTCKVPYLFNETEKKFVTYEDATSIDWKYQFIREKGLAGMMAWQLNQDYNDKLTIAMKNAKNKYMG